MVRLLLYMRARINVPAPTLDDIPDDHTDIGRDVQNSPPDMLFISCG